MSVFPKCLALSPDNQFLKINFCLLLIASLSVGCSRTDNLTTQSPEENEPTDAGEASDSKQLQPLSFVHKAPPVIADGRPKTIILVPVTNETGKVVVFEERIARSCSCSEAELKSRKLAAGETTDLIVSMNLGGRNGLQHIGVTLTDGSGRQWSYLIEIEIYQQSRFTTWNETISFAGAEPGDLLEKEISFEVFAYEQRLLPEAIDVNSDNPNISVKKIRTIEVQEATKGIWIRRFLMNLECHAPKKTGPFHGELKAKFQYGVETKEKTVNLTGFVKSLMEISPAYVFFGSVTPGPEKIVKRLVIRRSDGEELKVSSIESSDRRVTAKIERTQSKSAVILELSLDASSFEKPSSGKISVGTNIPKEPIVSVSFATVVDLK